jgi:hypothetical protein
LGIGKWRLMLMGASMQARLRTTLAAMSAVSFLFLPGLMRDASAQIDLSNDVDLAWSDHPVCNPGALCPNPKALISGAPRLVPNASNAAALLKISLNIVKALNDPQDPGPSFNVDLHLDIRDAASECLQTVLPIGCSEPLRLTYTHSLQRGIIDLFPQDFSPLNFELPSRDLIITVGGQMRGTAHADAVTITLSGAGNEIILDRLGDVDEFHAGDARDIPRRSMSVVRALNELAAAPRQNPGVELDVAGANRPVGFTHTFALPQDAIIEGATLTLRVTSNRRGFSNDFILLDGELIFLRDLRGFAPVPGETYLRTIDLAHLLPDLSDGQLNVILADDSAVDFSDLMVRLRDR